MAAKASFRDPWIKTKRGSLVKVDPLFVYILAGIACFIVASAERNYKIHLDKFVKVSWDDSFGNFSGVEMVKYNRSTSALSGIFQIVVDPRPDLMTSLEGYEKVGTEYMLSGIQVGEELLCGLLDKYGDLVLSPEDTTTTNFKFKCPVVNGTYFIENYRPDENNMPEDVPGNDWRFDMKAWYPDQPDNLLFHFQVFLKVERVVTNWKPGMV